MAKYIIYFNQQWVGDHSEAWFESRGPLARAVVADMEAAGVLVFAGGLVEEIDEAYGVLDSGAITDALSAGEFIGGLTIIDVPTDQDAQQWGIRVATACGWPQEVRRFKGN